MTSAVSGQAPFGWVRAARAGLGIRRALEGDTPFLFRVYDSTRERELALLPWTHEQKRGFLDMQARAQHLDYGRNYPDADRLVIEVARALSDEVASGSSSESAARQEPGGVIRPDVVGHASSEPVGRLYLDRRERTHRIVDIAFLPQARNRGFGTALIADLIDEAAALGKDVSIHVESFNPAQRLYARLGFVMVEDQGVYRLMVSSGAKDGRDQVKTA